jgi:hypothetical protein
MQSHSLSLSVVTSGVEATIGSLDTSRWKLFSSIMERNGPGLITDIIQIFV